MKQLKIFLTFIIIASCFSSVSAIDGITQKNMIISKYELSKTQNGKKYIYHMDKIFERISDDENLIKQLEKKLSLLKKEVNYNKLDKKTQYIVDYLYGRNQVYINNINEKQKIIDKLYNERKLDCKKELTDKGKDILNNDFNKDLSINEWCGLSRLYLHRNNTLISLPKEIGNLKNLVGINIYSSSIENIPKEIGNLEGLKYLDLNYNNISLLPKEIGNLKSLIALSIAGNNIEILPKEIGNLKNLQFLHAHNNKLTSLPTEIGNLKNLKELYLYNNEGISPFDNRYNNSYYLTDSNSYMSIFFEHSFEKVFIIVY